MEIEQAFALFGGITVLVLLISNILKDFYIQKSIPLDKVSELIARARVYADNTATPVDNILLDTAEDLVGALTPNQPDATPEA